MSGFIKLYRSINQNQLLDNDNSALVVFIKILTNANRLTGTYTTGRNKFAVACNLKPTTLYGVLKRLESSSIIRLKSDRNSTTIYICNWWKYQQDKDKSPSQDRSSDDTIQEGEREGESNIQSPVKKRVVKSRRDVLGILNKVTGRNFSVEPVGIEKTKNLFTDEVIERALRNMYKEEWHKTKMSTLKSDYLLRATTIDQFKDFKRPDEKYVLQGSTVKQTVTANKPIDDREQYKREYGRK